MTNVVVPPILNNPELSGSLSGITIEIPNPPKILDYLNLGQIVSLNIKGKISDVVSDKKLLQLDLTSLGITENPETLELDLPQKIDVPKESKNIQLRLVAKSPSKAVVKLVAVDGNKIENFMKADGQHKLFQSENSKLSDVLVGKLESDNRLSGGDVIIKSPSSMEQIKLPHVSVMSMVQNQIPVKDIPLPLQKILATIQVETKLVVAENNNLNQPTDSTTGKMPQLRTVPETISKITSQLKNIVNQQSLSPLVVKTEPLPNLSQPQPMMGFQEILPELQSLPGKIVPAQVVEQGGRLVLQTPLGDIIPETPIKFPLGEKITLQISDVFLPPELSEQTSKPHLQKQIIKTSLTEILRPLKKALSPLVYEQIVSKIPAPTPKLLSNIMSFMKAAQKEDISLWLGQETVDHLRLSGVQERQALSQLETFLVSHRDENPQWRIIEIPFLSAENITMIKVATRHLSDEEEEPQKKEKKNKASRFIVDTNFTVLGNFQFDGFSLPEDRRFDLIIRTEKTIPEDMVAQMMTVFRNALGEVEYAGNIIIKIKEKFIKLCDDNANTTLLPEGIFI